MPTYEYECRGCGRRFDRVQSFHDEPVRVCPHCGGVTRRVIQPVGVVFKGSGWYINDSRKPDSSPDSAANNKEGSPKEDSSKEGAGKEGAGKEGASKEGSSKEGGNKEGANQGSGGKEGGSKEGGSKEGSSRAASKESGRGDSGPANKVAEAGSKPAPPASTKPGSSGGES